MTNATTNDATNDATSIDEQLTRVKELLAKADAKMHGHVLIFAKEDGTLDMVSSAEEAYDEHTDPKGRGWWTGAEELRKLIPESAEILVERCDWDIQVDRDLDGKKQPFYTGNPSDSELLAVVNHVWKSLE